MRTTPAFDMATLDPADPSSIAALIAFHDARFCGARMEDTPPPNPPVDTPPPGGGAEEKGFPENTPIAEMTVEQQAAYWKFQSRKHESIARARGDYDELKTAKSELDELKKQGLSDAEKAVAAAREEGLAAGRAEATRELGPRLVGSHVLAALAEKKVPTEQAKSLVEFLDHTKFLTETGEVDADKVTAYAAGVATGDGKQQHWPDMGGGDRGPQLRQTDREAGIAEAQKRFGTKN